MRKLELGNRMLVMVALCTIGLLLVGYAVWTRFPAEQPIARNVNVPKVPYTACYYETKTVDVDTPYLLIDLSDTTNYPHSATNEIIVHRVIAQGAVSGAHHWHLTTGVVVENDTTNGTAIWITNLHLSSLSGMFAPPQRAYDSGGLNLRASGSALTYAVANGHSELTSWQSDTAISATVGTTGTVAVGDLVILADEISDGSTLGFSICVDYDTE